MDVTLDEDFEDAAGEAVMDAVYDSLIGQRDNLVHEAIQQSREALEDFDDQYNVGPIWNSLSGPEVDRSDGEITVRWSFDHPAAGYFEYGTPDNYTIEGDPILSFVWEDPPAWVKDEFEREGDGWRVFFGEVDSGEGIAETRFTRWGLRWLRWQLEDR
jgi:hypothetical protein